MFMHLENKGNTSWERKWKSSIKYACILLKKKFGQLNVHAV